MTGPSIGGGFRKLLIEQLKVWTVKARLMQSFLAAEQVSWPQAAPYRWQASLFERTTIAIDVAASSISTAGHSKGQIRHYGFHFVPLSRRSLESVTCRLWRQTTSKFSLSSTAAVDSKQMKPWDGYTTAEPVELGQGLAGAQPHSW
ncbi:hypothetical protein [Bradyrhizobium canariense]|uniref:hypothetical protein n=1 Tax=Bradyrhizobium canariense TaxID=255045 RepID=UPI0011783418|nr:hypothetical protein [Bradyrhizobium canariense]